MRRSELLTQLARAGDYGPLMDALEDASSYSLPRLKGMGVHKQLRCFRMPLANLFDRWAGGGQEIESDCQVEFMIRSARSGGVRRAALFAYAKLIGGNDEHDVPSVDCGLHNSAPAICLAWEIPGDLAKPDHLVGLVRLGIATSLAVFMARSPTILRLGLVDLLAILPTVLTETI